MEEKKTLWSDAYQWAYDRYVGNDLKEIALYEEERVRTDIAQAVCYLRNQAGLSHKQLAELAGTTPALIEDIEAADYEEDFLLMAPRIAAALHERMEVRFVPEENPEAIGLAV